LYLPKLPDFTRMQNWLAEAVASDAALNRKRTLACTLTNRLDCKWLVISVSILESFSLQSLTAFDFPLDD